jgi:O-antigen/teichoic acid export membrane protein
MDKYKKLFSNATILGIGTFSSKLLVFFLVRFYTSCLTKAEYGTADLITQTATFLIPILSLGIYDAVFRFCIDDVNNRKRILSSGLILLTASSVIFAFFTPLLDLISLTEGYGWLIILYAISSSLHSLFAQFVRSRGEMKLFAIQGIVGTVLTISFNLIFLLGFDMDVLGYVLSVVLADALCSIFIFLVSGFHKEIDLSLFDFKTVKSMLRYSLPLIPTTIFWWVTNVSDRYMIRYMIDADTNGLYAVSNKLPTILILISGIFCEAWQYSAVKEKGDGERAHSDFFAKTFDNFQAVMFISATFLIAFSQIATRILTTGDYFESWRYIPILSCATIFSSLVTFMGVIYLMEKKSMLSFYTALIGALLNLGLNYLLIPTPLGANGAAIATFASYFVVFIIRAINTKKYMDFKMNLPVLICNTLIVIAQSLILLSADSYPVIPQIL